MPQLKDILEKEKERTSPDQCRMLHLFREGTFYRAYEWSAWLLVRCYPDLKVTHRLLKGGEDIVFVGFPLTSLERYTPREAAVVPVDDKCVDIVLPSDDADCESMQTGFANWKQAQPLTEASKKKDDERQQVERRNASPRLTDIMLDIMAYPIEQHSPMECMAFLSDMKQRISQIL